MKRNSTGLLLFLCGFFFSLVPQSEGQSLKSRIEREKNFLKIQTIAEAYYDSINLGLRKLAPGDSKYKHWKREEDFLKNHLDKNGNLANYIALNMKADAEVKRTEEQNERTTNSEWSFNGPSAHPEVPTSYHFIGKGRVDRIAFHPTNTSIILLGTPAGGIWKTINGGLSWYNVNNNLPSMGISGIAFAKNNSNIVYAITGCGDGLGVTLSAGVLKSMDGGETWEKTANLSLDAFSAYQLTINPADDNHVWVATTIGLFKTRDGGDSWFQMYSGTKFYDVKKKPGDNNIYYAVSGTTFYRLADQSGGYSGNPTFYMNGGRKGIAVTEAAPERVYLLAGPTTSDTTFQGFYKSEASGGAASFVLQATEPNVFGGEGGGGPDQSGYDFCVTASQSNPDIVMVGGLVSWKTTDAGVTWNNITTYGSNSSSPSYVHPDIHDLQINPLNNYLYCASDGGFYRSTDLGLTWLNLTSTISTTMFYHIAGFETNVDYFAGGTQDNGMKFRSENSTIMDHVSGADGHAVAFHPSDPTIFYGSTNSALDRYTNSGQTLTHITPKPYWFMKVATHRTNGNIVFAGATKLYKSIDMGSSWDTLLYPANQSIATCKSDTNRLYVSGVGDDGIHKMYRLDSLGANSVRVDQNPGFPTSNFITDIAVHPILSNKLYITLAGYTENEKVFTSSNGGDSWVNISSGLPNVPIYSIAVSSNNDVYAGTEIGVFYRPNVGSNWRPFRNGLPVCTVRDMVLYDSENLLRIGTFGRGAWQSPTANGICETTLTSLPPVMEGFRFYEASSSISTNSIITGGYGTDVYLKAGAFIDLTEGFHAKDENTLVKVYIGACGEGIPANIKENHNSKN